MEAYLHKDFKKSFKKLSRSLQIQVDERILLFCEDQFSQLLNNHALKGKYEGFRSINISGDLRAIYKMLADNLAYFVEIDTHSNLYK